MIMTWDRHFLNLTGRHEHLLNSTGRQGASLKSTCNIRTPPPPVKGPHIESNASTWTLSKQMRSVIKVSQYLTKVCLERFVRTVATPHYTDIHASKPILIVASAQYKWTSEQQPPCRHVSEILLVETSRGYIKKNYLIPPNLSN